MPSSVHILNMSVENCCLLYAGDHTKITSIQMIICLFKLNIWETTGKRFIVKGF